MEFSSSPTAGSGVTFPGGASEPWTTIKKTTDTSRNNNTLADDPDFQFAMAASTKYAFRLRVTGNNGSAGDQKFRIVGPTSPTLVKMVRRFIIGAGTAWTIALVSAFDAADVSVLGAAGQHRIEVDGIVHVGASGGTFKYQWAQAATEVSPVCTLWAGSTLEWMVI